MVSYAAISRLALGDIRFLLLEEPGNSHPVSLASLHQSMQDEDKPSCPDGEESGLLKALDVGTIPLEDVDPKIKVPPKI